MGSTNSTPNYELSQFIGTDKPAWLQDYNGDMLKIDSGIAGAKTAADNAQSAADGAQGDATSALSGIADINTELGTVETTLGTAVGNINTINSLIGNGTPTTTDQTIIGAINELNSNKLNISAVENKKVYSEQKAVSVTADGTETLGDVLQRLQAATNAILHGLGNDVRFIPLDLYTPTYYNIPHRISGLTLANNQDVLIDNCIAFISGGDVIVRQIFANADSNYAYAASAVNGTVTDDTNSVPTNGDVFTFEYRLEYSIV